MNKDGIGLSPTHKKGKATSSVGNPRPRLDSTAESALFKYARDLRRAFVSCDSQNPFFARHVTPDFKMRHECNVGPMDVEDYLAFLRDKFASAAYEGTRVSVNNEWVDFVNSSKNPHARVWQLVRISKPTQGIVTNGLYLTMWRLGPDDTWMCYLCECYQIDPSISGQMVPCF